MVGHVRPPFWKEINEEHEATQQSQSLYIDNEEAEDGPILASSIVNLIRCPKRRRIGHPL